MNNVVIHPSCLVFLDATGNGTLMPARTAIIQLLCDHEAIEPYVLDEVTEGTLSYVHSLKIGSTIAVAEFAKIVMLEFKARGHTVELRNPQA